VSNFLITGVPISNTFSNPSITPEANLSHPRPIIAKAITTQVQIVKPSKERLAFDKAVCNGLNLDLTGNEIRSL
jgi:hypothetical protein